MPTLVEWSKSSSILYCHLHDVHTCMPAFCKVIDPSTINNHRILWHYISRCLFIVKCPHRCRQIRFCPKETFLNPLLYIVLGIYIFGYCCMMAFFLRLWRSNAINKNCVFKFPFPSFKLRTSFLCSNVIRMTVYWKASLKKILTSFAQFFFVVKPKPSGKLRRLAPSFGIILAC